MKSGSLSQYFSGVAAKRLSAVEAHPEKSNQHEFDGITPLRVILGSPADAVSYPAMFVLLSDDDETALVNERSVTWYDSRKDQEHRSAEYRLYFQSCPVMERAAEGDLLIIAKRPDNTLLIVVTEKGSTAENQVRWLFGISEEPAPRGRLKLIIKNEQDADERELDFASRQILEALGIDIEETAENLLETLLIKFSGTFPTTREFSAFARETLVGHSLLDPPDGVIVDLMEHEELLFRTLERHIVQQKLDAGFGDVDDFVAFSLSVHQRRKSRAGYALENHLEAIFTAHNVAFARTKVTENKAKPDFLFPGVAQYHDAAFPPARLTMLGAKATCKDRWRQVLSEAKRIPNKHLLTLEPGISENQTNEMQDHKVQLVVPTPLHSSYKPKQITWLMPLSAFLDLAKHRER